MAITQDQWLDLLLKIGLISGLIAITAWVAVYSRLADWWASPLGRTIVIEATGLAALFVPLILSDFFHLNRLDSYIAAWADVSLIGLVTPLMLWRIVVFARMGPSPERKRRRAARRGTQPMVPSSPRDWGDDGSS